MSSLPVGLGFSKNQVGVAIVGWGRFFRVGLKILSPFHKHENGSELALSVHQFVEWQIVTFCM